MVTRDPATATERLWREFHDRLRAFVARRVSDPADVDDLIQGIFLQIHQRLSTLTDSDRLEAWIYQITRNAIIDHYRARAKRLDRPSPDHTITAELADTLPEPVDPEDPGRELATCLSPLIDRLPATYRDAVVLSELSGLPQREVAARLGLSVSGAKSRVQRGRQRLKSLLLTCCRVEQDRRGGIVGIELQRPPAGLTCAPISPGCR